MFEQHFILTSVGVALAPLLLEPPLLELPLLTSVAALLPVEVEISQAIPFHPVLHVHKAIH
jgi:hypothetical protein|tara:strand:+ start:109 stop:291 length:183 start_codon:yes stop_codon:yes gene_type:complete